MAGTGKGGCEKTFPTADSPAEEKLAHVSRRRVYVPRRTSLNWYSFGGEVGVCPVDDLGCWDEFRADMLARGMK